MNKEVIEPSHYQEEGGLECIVAMQMLTDKHAVLNFCLLNAVKYLYRQDKKGVADMDVQKARWYYTVYSIMRSNHSLQDALSFVRSEAYKKSYFPAFDSTKFASFIKGLKDVDYNAFNLIGYLDRHLHIRQQFYCVTIERGVVDNARVVQEFEHTDIMTTGLVSQTINSYGSSTLELYQKGRVLATIPLPMPYMGWELAKALNYSTPTKDVIVLADFKEEFDLNPADVSTL